MPPTASPRPAGPRWRRWRTWRSGSAWPSAAIPILVVSAFYLPVRYRFIRRATAGQRFVDAVEDLDLFALRALARQPMHVLAKVSDDPAGAWRRRDPVVTRTLAELELRANGLRPPRVQAG